MTRQEYRVVWKRDGCRRKEKRYVRRASAEKFITLLGQEPWKAFGRAPDDYFCCAGSKYECGCGGITVREDSDNRRERQPVIEYAYMETRTVVASDWQVIS